MFLSDPEDKCETRLIMFGPGIESDHTQLSDRILNSHDNGLNATDLVPALVPGGFGSGVRIEFKQISSFDLICLYINSKRVRSNLKGSSRFLKENNRLLIKDATEQTDGVLHQHVLKLLYTLHGLIFVVCDQSEDVKHELDIMLAG